VSAGEPGAVAAPRIRVGRGARATEELLLSDLDAVLPSSPADLALLALPVVVVVPSRSLRLHLAARLLERRGRAAAGVEIVTLHGLASGVVARGQGRRRAGARLLPVLVSRFAGREKALRDLAVSLEDGELPVIATVRDLLDAGFVPEGAEALAELLQGHRDEAERERALAVTRVAAGVARVLEAGDLEVPSDLLRRASGLLRADPDRALPARAVRIHGFADATGVATDLIETLLRHRGAWLYLDQPPNPVEPAEPDPGIAFSERFLRRLEGVASPEPAGSPVPPAGAPALFRAPGSHAEVRETARRIRALLDGGAQPERIGVVAREVAPFALAISSHFERLGIPFSAPDAAGSVDAAARRVRALVEVLRRGSEASADSWLTAAAGTDGFDLRLALHACGAARLGDVATLEPDGLLDANGEFVLPVRRGLAELPGEGDDEARRVAPRRRLAGARLRHAVRRAATWVSLVDAWPAEAGVADHLRRLRRLLEEAMGWRRERPGAEAVRRLLGALDAELPEEVALTREEFLMLVRRGLEECSAPALGGRGGGVQVLSAVAARARTFEHLFVLGLNRDSFPRQVREDPLLPDRVRLAIERDVLPEIPIKRRGFDEERYLFAQLLSSAASVTLSWQACDDDGKARPPSPLIERLRLAHAAHDVPLVGAVLAPVAGELRPADEHAVLAALYSPRREFGGVLEVACLRAGGEEGRALAAARLAVLDELDPDRRTAEGRRRSSLVGPYFGFVGAPREGADPRRRDPALTTAEAVAACPWQAFLRRILHLEPSPDPLAAATGVGPLLVGDAVHGALQAIVTARGHALARTVAGALEARSAAVFWPAQAELDATLRELCARLVREEGGTLPGLERVLEARVRPFLEVARRLLWADQEAGPAALGIEAEGDVGVEDADGTPRRLSFRADLMEEIGGRVALTDFKTGAPLSRAKTDDTRRKHLLAAVRRGEALQAAAYALGVHDRPAVGRYAYLRPDLDDGIRVLAVDGEDAELASGFRAAVRVLLGAWDLGSLFPRLEERDTPDEPARCSVCEVREACVRGDSGARRRLARWATARRPGADANRGLSAAEAALAALWSLGAGGSGDGGEEAR
jgi:PD-(D/E)XK nuclease superfamily